LRQTEPKRRGKTAPFFCARMRAKDRQREPDREQKRSQQTKPKGERKTDHKQTNTKRQRDRTTDKAKPNRQSQQQQTDREQKRGIFGALGLSLFYDLRGIIYDLPCTFVMIRARTPNKAQYKPNRAPQTTQTNRQTPREFGVHFGRLHPV
jgi:hypothetical protein